MHGNDRWMKAKDISRGVKATGKNWAYLNIQEENQELPSGIAFQRDVQDCREIENVKEVNSVFVPSTRHNEYDVKCAKKKELEESNNLVFLKRIPILVKNSCLPDG